MHTILILNGPNLNLLGKREKHHYGLETLQDINNRLSHLGKELNVELDFFQSNSEHELIEKIHKCLDSPCDFIIINPAAFTHTSIALRDALLAVEKPFIEVHLSNIFRREAFRQKSFFSDIAIGVISGLGAQGYLMALRYANAYLKSE